MSAPDSGGGVFLSYASQDAAAARRICDALRAAGIEVWLDQNELRGGDAWDRRIRRQVRECVLFLPVISSQTQSRKEGYFRLEWRLAVERMQRMSDRAAFLVPVVIDETPEEAADVPDIFRAAQWSRLPDGETTKQFVGLIRSLVAPTSVQAAETRSTRAAAPIAASPENARRTPRAAAWLAIAVLGAGVLGAVYFNYGSGFGESRAAADLSSPSALSIIVLPFANHTGDDRKDYIADALTSSITSGIARIRDAYVVPAQTAYTYKGQSLTVQEVARDAGVRFVLSGNVQAAGAQARIGVQLSGGTNAATLWNETFSGDLNDLFALQDRVTTLVANSLRRELVIAADREKGRLAEDAESTDLLLRARALELQNASFDGQRQIEQMYRTVLAREPDNAAALAGLAGNLAISATWGLYTPKSTERQGELFAEAEQLAERATQIAPGTSGLQDIRGWAALFRADFESAERIFEAIREQAPLLPHSYNNLGVLAYLKYEPRKALEYFKRAEDLSPGARRDYLLANRAIAYLQLGEYDAAIENAETGLVVNPRLENVLALLAVAYSLRGDDDAAASWAAKAKAANVTPSDVMGYPVGSAEYEQWADAVLRPTWRKLELLE